MRKAATNMDSLGEYLGPTLLCDFDRSPSIRSVAKRLTEGMVDHRQIFNSVYQFVRRLHYRLEDWDVTASETLNKSWGMCSGKTNLLVAMLRSLGIPARYKVYRIESEGKLWKWVAKQDHNLARQMGEPTREQDHVTAEVYLDSWESYDPSRDPTFEEGLRRLGIPLERKPATVAGGKLELTVLASIDEWAQSRQRARRFREDRKLVFSQINKQFDKIRLLGSKENGENH